MRINDSSHQNEAKNEAFHRMDCAVLYISKSDVKMSAWTAQLRKTRTHEVI